MTLLSSRRIVSVRPTSPQEDSHGRTQRERGEGDGYLHHMAVPEDRALIARARNGDALAFEELKKMCEFRLGRDPGPPPAEGQDVPVPPVPLEKLIACLQELAKSVERHTRAGGRRGYLKFIDQFLK